MSFPTIKLLEGAGHLPITFQIKNNLKHAISSGHLSPNTQLPSVRDLAAELEVAANTVARAYKELQEEGLLVTHAGRGTFVSNLIEPSTVERQSSTTLSAVLTPALRSALAIGFTRDDISRAVDEFFAKSRITVGLVGINETIVSKWEAIIEREFGDLGVDVISFTLHEVESNFAAIQEELQLARYIFSLITTYGEVRSFFRGKNWRIVALITELSMATHAALAELPTEGLIGLVCEDMYVNNLMGLITAYCSSDRIRRVSPDNEEELRELIADVDTVLHTLSPTEKISHLVDPKTRLIEMEFLPNRSCFEQLHQMLEAEVVNG